MGENPPFGLLIWLTNDPGPGDSLQKVAAGRPSAWTQQVLQGMLT